MPDLFLLLQLQQIFGGIGSISKNQNMLIYYISKLSDLNNVIKPHFQKYSLLTQKAADFILFKEVVKLMNNKEHLSIEGIQKIISIKSSMNLGISDFNNSEFKIYIPVKRPIILIKNILNFNWVSGFTTGEGNFDVNILK